MRMTVYSRNETILVTTSWLHWNLLS